MPDLEPGDEVIVETGTLVYTYVLDTGGDDLTVRFTAVWVLDALPTNPTDGVQPPPRNRGSGCSPSPPARSSSTPTTG